MRTLFLVLVACSSLIVSGCAEKVEPPQSQGLEIHAPGVDVTIEPEQGVHVKAGGTEVNADKEQGVNVEAPGVDVEVERTKAGEE